MTMQLSRSEQKRRIKEVEQLVRELVELPDQILNRLPGDEELIALCKETKSLKGGARKRQIKYITKLLKKEPVTELYDFLSKRKGASLHRKKQLHELEYLRDNLLDEAIALRKVLRSEQQELSETWESATITEIRKQMPAIDPIALSRLAAIFARTRQPRHSREIFRLLRAAQEQGEREQHRG
ncbi:MAG TPA: DUF615 domain-containing protein [Desulfobulbus sp.]|nr:DUF615 domain-containing protein [Desulfobulbus sp.]